MIVVLDACVLYPASLRDVLLTLAALDAFEARWSEEILDEVRRNVIADYPDIDPQRFTSHTIGAMLRAFPDALAHADPATFETLDNDPDDRHVAAVALKSGAQGIITLNIKDFRSEVLERAGVEITTPGDLIDRMLDDFPEIAQTAVEHLAGRWTNPSRTAIEITQDLAIHPTMASPMNRLRDQLPR